MGIRPGGGAGAGVGASEVGVEVGMAFGVDGEKVEEVEGRGVWDEEGWGCCVSVWAWD